MKKGENKVSAPGYFKGLGGAVLGGILAFLMWVMTAYFVGGNLHLSFGFVLALFVYYGYFSFGGKKAKGFFAVYLPLVFLLGFLAAAVYKQQLPRICRRLLSWQPAGRIFRYAERQCAAGIFAVWQCVAVLRHWRDL